MKSFRLIRPSDKYADEIRAYRQEFLAADGHSHGDSGLGKAEDIHAWIEQCRLTEHQETVPVPGWVEADQFMLVCGSEHRILGMINFRHYLFRYVPAISLFSLRTGGYGGADAS